MSSVPDEGRPRHGFVLLESRLFRLQRSLSDTNGYDPLIHRGSQGGVIRAMFEAFSTAGPADIGAARRLVRRLSQVADGFKRVYLGLVQDVSGLLEAARR